VQIDLACAAKRNRKVACKPEATSIITVWCHVSIESVKCLNDIFRILTSRAIDWCMNELILRGSRGVGESWGGAPDIYWATFTKY